MSTGNRSKQRTNKVPGKARRRRFRLPPWLLPAAALAMMVMLMQNVRAQNGPPAAADAAAAADDAAPAGGEVVEEVATTPPVKQSYLDLFKAGGIFMYPLLLCSVLAVAIVVERFVSLRRARVVPADFLPGLRAVFRDPRRDGPAALDYCNRYDTSIARIVAAGIKRFPRGPTAVEKAVEDTGANEALKLRRNMRALYALGSVGTLLGLIGTISGMIKAFQAASVGGMAGKAERLSQGIYEAFICTFGGLAVAIIATAFYYFFLGRVETYISELNDSINDFADEHLHGSAAAATEEDMPPMPVLATAGVR